MMPLGLLVMVVVAVTTLIVPGDAVPEKVEVAPDDWGPAIIVTEKSPVYCDPGVSHTCLMVQSFVWDV